MKDNAKTEMKDNAKQKPSERRAAEERRLDEAIEESFPASDPSATTPTSAGGPQRSRAKRAAVPSKSARRSRSTVKRDRGNASASSGS